MLTSELCGRLSSAAKISFKHDGWGQWSSTKLLENLESTAKPGKRRLQKNAILAARAQKELQLLKHSLAVANLPDIHAGRIYGAKKPVPLMVAFLLVGACTYTQRRPKRGKGDFHYETFYREYFMVLNELKKYDSSFIRHKESRKKEEIKKAVNDRQNGARNDKGEAKEYKKIEPEGLHSRMFTQMHDETSGCTFATWCSNIKRSAMVRVIEDYRVLDLLDVVRGFTKATTLESIQELKNQIKIYQASLIDRDIGAVNPEVISSITKLISDLACEMITLDDDQFDRLKTYVFGRGYWPEKPEAESKGSSLDASMLFGLSYH